MALTLSEYLLRDFAVERVDAALLELGDEGVRFPATQPAYFHLVLSGKVHVQLEKSGETAQLNPGDFVLLLYGAAHTVGSGQVGRPRALRTQELWLAQDEPAVLKSGSATAETHVLSGRLQLTRTLRTAPVNRALPHLLFYAPSRAAAPVEAMPLADMKQIEKNCRGPGASAFISTLAQMYFMQTLRQVHGDMSQAFPVHIGSPDAGRMAAVVRKIRAHPDRRWTVASLAQEVGYSRASFAAKFQAYAGMGPIKFVSRTRLMHAATMLQSNPELPLWEVAKRVGYDPQGSFTRAFKAHFGVSPRRYVEQLTQEARK